MTSREFIQRQFGNADGKTRYLSSIVKDGRGDIYSYGYHYPLLFKVGGLVFRNTRGYSVTTGKHIGWAGANNYAVDGKLVEALDVELSGCSQYGWLNAGNAPAVPALLNKRRNSWEKATDRQILKAIIRDLSTTRDRLQSQLDAKKRRDTKIFNSLSYELAKVLAAINTVEEAL